MSRTSPPDVERRALALFERLADRPDTRKLRERLIARETPAVIARLEALEASAARAKGAIPTLIPGSGEAGQGALPPARVGTFRLIERIGKGGMGDVWLGERDDGLYEQMVAIKLIQRHALARAASAFDDERRFLARLEHPNIARLIDGGVTDDGLPWLAMEYVEGEAIDEAGRARSANDCVRLFVKAADAVQFAHGRLVAHADLKPGNIMVTGDGRVKLLDFGVAGLIGGASRSTTGSGPMTREFASPQRQAGAGPSVADDVFALGKTLSQMLGKRGDAELHSIVAKAQATALEERYGSVAELIADLDRWRDQLPVSAMPDRLTYRASKFVDRHRKGVLATGIALVLLSATSIIATTNYVRAEQTRARAEARFGEVRRLAGFMLFDLYDELARQPGSLSKRAEIARTSAVYLEKLRVSRDAPADLRLDTARSYRRLAAIEGLPGVSNLGHPERAAVALDQAKALLHALLAQRPEDVEALTELGWVNADQWLLAGDGSESAKRIDVARQHFRHAAAIKADSPQTALGLIAMDGAEAYRLTWNDQPADGRDLAEGALRALRVQSWPKALVGERDRLELRLINILGDATYYAGDMPGALAIYRQAWDVIETQRKVHGDTPHLRVARGFSAYNISSTMGDMGRSEDSLAMARSTTSDLEAMLTREQDASAEKILLMLYGQQAVALENLGDLAGALGPLQAGVALREARRARSPRDYQGRRDLAIGLAQQARVLGKSGRAADACRAAQRTLAIWAKLKAEGAIGGRDAAREVDGPQVLAATYCRT